VYYTGMKSLADLITLHPVPGMRQSLERGMIADALTRVLGVPVTARQVRFEAGTLTLAAPPIVKSALSVRQNDVQEALRSYGLSLVTVR
jgi:hypothetical protein